MVHLPLQEALPLSLQWMMKQQQQKKKMMMMMMMMMMMKTGEQKVKQ